MPCQLYEYCVTYMQVDDEAAGTLPALASASASAATAAFIVDGSPALSPRAPWLGGSVARWCANKVRRHLDSASAPDIAERFLILNANRMHMHVLMMTLRVREIGAGTHLRREM